MNKLKSIVTNKLLFGVVRVSSKKQENNSSISRQLECLLKKGVPRDQIYRVSGSARDSSFPQLESILASRKKNEVLVFTEASRFSRNYFWAVNQVNTLYNRGASIWPLNFNKPLLKGKKLHIFYADVLKAETVGNLINQRASLGIREHKRIGQYKGSKKKLSKGQQRALCLDLEKLGVRYSLTFLQKKYSISRSTIYRYRKLFLRRDVLAVAECRVEKVQAFSSLSTIIH